MAAVFLLPPANRKKLPDQSEKGHGPKKEIKGTVSLLTLPFKKKEHVYPFFNCLYARGDIPMILLKRREK